jgi:exodeoxyribonuclease VII large subunit
MRLTGMLSRLEILDPVNVLKRGYSITTLKGKILKKTDEVSTGDILKTKLIDGEIDSRVV